MPWLGLWTLSTKGEANIFQEQLQIFLSLAEELELKGFNGSSEEENTKESFVDNYQRGPHVGRKRNTYEKGADGYSCTNCDYTSKKKDHVREHVEKHIDGLEYPCNVCNRVYRSSHSFRDHKRRGICSNL